jgi:hypothetical protein
LSGRCQLSRQPPTTPETVVVVRPQWSRPEARRPFIDACRSVRIRETMPKDQAKKLKLEPGYYFREFSAKRNFAPPRRGAIRNDGPRVTAPIDTPSAESHIRLRTYGTFYSLKFVIVNRTPKRPPTLPERSPP